MVKEAAAEEAIYRDKEKFVTSSYKRKLAEREKWDKEDEKVKQKEEENAVEKKGMGAFYANMNKVRRVRVLWESLSFVMHTYTHLLVFVTCRTFQWELQSRRMARKTASQRCLPRQKLPKRP